MKDRVDTTGLIWLELSLGCAKCHSHKYDPISQTEYYQMFAFFNQTADAYRYDDAPKKDLPSAFHYQQQKELVEQLAAARKKLDGSSHETEATLKLIAELERQLEENTLAMKLPAVPVMQELPEPKHRTTRLLIKGDFLNPGPEVQAGVPKSLRAMPDRRLMNRMGLARWLMDKENPLTARVTVNRIWSRMFGVGLVETEEDFGTQGELPSHPQLLDWLAIEFRDAHRWSRKELCKTIVMSATYRQSSEVTSELIKRDPRNRLLARGPRFRLEAEMIRDQALAVSGLLGRKLYGPPVMPPQPDGVWKTVYNSGRWITSQGEDRYRRGLYTHICETDDGLSVVPAARCRQRRSLPAAADSHQYGHRRVGHAQRSRLHRSRPDACPPRDWRGPGRCVTAGRVGLATRHGSSATEGGDKPHRTADHYRHTRMRRRRWPPFCWALCPRT